GHAPSRLLENLITYHDPEKFDLAVISTERHQFHWLEYPYNVYSSESSRVRAPDRLEAFKQRGIPVKVLDDMLTYDSASARTLALLNDFNANVAVFHGPDVINNMTAQVTGTPLRVLFEHGTPPAYPGYDLAVLSSHETAEKNMALLDRIGTKVSV